EVGHGEDLAEHCRFRKQSQRVALHLVGRYQQDLALSLKHGSGDVSIHRFEEGDGAIVERNVNVFTIDTGIAHLVYILRIQACGPYLAVEIHAGAQRSWRLESLGLGGSEEKCAKCYL